MSLIRGDVALKTTPLALGERAELYFFVFVLLYGAGALVQLVIQGPIPLRGAVVLETSPLRAIWAVCYVITAVLAVRRIAIFSQLLREQPALMSLCVLILGSVLWASDAELSLERAATTIIGLMIGAYLGMRYGVDGVIRLTAIALGIATVSSLALMLFAPAWGTMAFIHPGSWLGVFSHKNALGSMSLLGILCFRFVLREAERFDRRLWQGLIVGALILLIGSRSMTAIVGLVMLEGAGFGLKLFQRSRADVKMALAGFILALVVFIPLLWVVLDWALPLIGRDITFTGRADLWRLGLEAFEQKPITGYGFDSFWADHGAYGGAQIRALVGWAAPHVHNSWLELGLGLGALGLVLFATSLFSAIGRTLALIRWRGEPGDYFVGVFWCYVLLYSFDEHVFLVRNDILTFLFAAFATTSLVDWRAWGAPKN